MLQQSTALSSSFHSTFQYFKFQSQQCRKTRPSKNFKKKQKKKRKIAIFNLSRKKRDRTKHTHACIRDREGWSGEISVDNYRKCGCHRRARVASIGLSLSCGDRPRARDRPAFSINRYEALSLSSRNTRDKSERILCVTQQKKEQVRY